MAATTRCAVLFVLVVNVVIIRGQWLIDYDDNDSDYDYGGESFHQQSSATVFTVA